MVFERAKAQCRRDGYTVVAVAGDIYVELVQDRDHVLSLQDG